jgi:CubicO group peptidase (beta-lactamase class C family)
MSASEAFFDLASLAKALVTAPLALEYLDLDIDRREQLGWVGDCVRETPITVRMLLSHQTGLPPWLPYNPSSSVAELVTKFDKYGEHNLLRAGIVGTSTYSDLNFRTLGELLEIEKGESYENLALKKGLSHRPWIGKPSPMFIPDGPDKDTWEIAATDGLASYPPREDYMPHDANSRAGMIGHAGFGANKQQFHKCLSNWLEEGWPIKQAIKHSIADDGYTQWGLGLLRVMDGPGKWGDELLKLEKSGSITSDGGNGNGNGCDSNGVYVLEETKCELEDFVIASSTEISKVGEPTCWWMHTGFSGPIVFVEPNKGIVVGLLMHRRGPEGELIDIDKRRARAYAMLRKLQK